VARSSSKEQQVERLEEVVERLREEMLEVSAESLSEPLGSWSPRDIVAHLIGWNGGLVEGCRQLLRGELPFYDVDPGDDYSRINERFVRQHASDDREALLADLEGSAERLGRFVGSLNASNWARDSGVVHGRERLTVRDTVDELIGDYIHHCEQLRAWAAPD